MRTINGLFKSYDEASRAAYALEDAGVPGEDISVIASRSANTSGENGPAHAAGVGAAIGGVGGLLAGLMLIVLPGIGPVLGAGWFATMLIGAAAGGVAGGLIGAMTAAGVPEQDAHVYAEGVKRGGTLVSARVDEAHAAVAHAILVNHRRIDPEERRREYAADGWDGFVESDIWDADIGREDLDSSDSPPLASRRSSRLGAAGRKGPEGRAVSRGDHGSSRRL